MNRLNRKEIIDRLAIKADAYKKDSAIFLDALLDVFAEALEKDESIHLRGFGTFETKTRQACRTYHPDNGEEVAIPSHKVCKYTQSQTLRRRLNGE